MFLVMLNGNRLTEKTMNKLVELFEDGSRYSCSYNKRELANHFQIDIRNIEKLLKRLEAASIVKKVKLGENSEEKLELRDSRNKIFFKFDKLAFRKYIASLPIRNDLSRYTFIVWREKVFNRLDLCCCV